MKQPILSLQFGYNSIDGQAVIQRRIVILPGQSADRVGQF